MSLDRSNPISPDDCLVPSSIQEAARAVVAWSLGCPQERVIIGSGCYGAQRTDRVAVGFTELMCAFARQDETDVFLQKLMLEKNLMVWLAADIAESRLHNRLVIYNNFAGHNLSDLEFEVILRRAEIRCRHFLARDDVWGIVQELAGNPRIDCLVSTLPRMTCCRRRGASACECCPHDNYKNS